MIEYELYLKKDQGVFSKVLSSIGGDGDDDGCRDEGFIERNRKYS